MRTPGHTCANWERKDSVSSAPEEPTGQGANDGVCVARDEELSNGSQVLQGPQQIYVHQFIGLC